MNAIQNNGYRKNTSSIEQNVNPRKIKEDRTDKGLEGEAGWEVFLGGVE